MDPSFFNPAPAFFVVRLTLLPCCSIASAMLSSNLCLLGLLWAYHILFLYSIQLPSTSTGLILILSWASLAYFIPLGILSSLHFFRHPWPIPLLHSHGFLLNLSVFPGPITIPFANFIPLGILSPLHFFGHPIAMITTLQKSTKFKNLFD